MREIKFRAWIKRWKQMQNVGGIDFVNGEVITYFGDTQHGQSTLTMEIDDIEIMQYTGLKDLNGVEIYDLDIVEGGIEGRRTLVEIDSIGWLRRELRDPFNKKYCNYKVIGNKFQNPELLEVAE